MPWSSDHGATDLCVTKQDLLHLVLFGVYALFTVQAVEGVNGVHGMICMAALANALGPSTEDGRMSELSL